MKKGQYFSERARLSEFFQEQLGEKNIFVEKIQYGIGNTQVEIYFSGNENDPNNFLSVNLDITLTPGHTNVYSENVIEAIKRSFNS